MRPLLLAVIILLIFQVGCEKEILLQPEAAQPEPSKEVALSISFVETTLLTSPIPGPQTPRSTGAIRVATRSGQRLLDFSKVQKTIQVDTNGNVFLDARYLEGNSDQRIPDELFRRIKDRIHPSDPQRKPITRYTISNNVYSGYASDGSLVRRQAFSSSRQGHRIDLADFVQVVNSLANPSAERIPFVASLAAKGAPFEVVGDRQIVVGEELPTRDGVERLRKRVDAISGIPSQMLHYNSKGELKEATQFEYRVIHGVPVRISVVNNSFGTSDPTKGKLIHTRHMMRSEISVYVRGQKKTTPEPMK